LLSAGKKKNVIFSTDIAHIQIPKQERGCNKSQPLPNGTEQMILHYREMHAEANRRNIAFFYTDVILN